MIKGKDTENKKFRDASQMISDEFCEIRALLDKRLVLYIITLILSVCPYDVRLKEDVAYLPLFYFDVDDFFQTYFMSESGNLWTRTKNRVID